MGVIGRADIRLVGGHSGSSRFADYLTSCRKYGFVNATYAYTGPLRERIARGLVEPVISVSPESPAGRLVCKGLSKAGILARPDENEFQLNGLGIGISALYTIMANEAVRSLTGESLLQLLIPDFESNAYAAGGGNEMTSGTPIPPPTETPIPTEVPSTPIPPPTPAPPITPTLSFTGPSGIPSTQIDVNVNLGATRGLYQEMFAEIPVVATGMEPITTTISTKMDCFGSTCSLDRVLPYNLPWTSGPTFLEVCSYGAQIVAETQDGTPHVFPIADTCEMIYDDALHRIGLPLVINDAP